MNNIESEYKNYKALIEKVGTENIQKRYALLFEEISLFLSYYNSESIKNKLFINERILMHSVLEYFEDIQKVKSSHDLDHTNSYKVFAYTAYWLLRRHPIQVMDIGNDDDDLVFVNEKFVLTMLMNFLTRDQETKPLIDVDRDIYNAFINSFYYFLKFRRIDPQSIEMILLSFRLGGVYPECKNKQ